jgi:hypothetical protein
LSLFGVVGEAKISLAIVQLVGVDVIDFLVCGGIE